MGLQLYSSVLGLMVTSSKGLMSHGVWPKSPTPRAPAPEAGHCWPVPPQETLKYSKAGLAQSLWGLWVLVHTGFFWALRESLEGMGLDSKHDFTSPTLSLGLLLCPWMWGIFFFCWDPTLSCCWLFSNKLQLGISCRRRWAHVFLLFFLALFLHSSHMLAK